MSAGSAKQDFHNEKPYFSNPFHYNVINPRLWKSGLDQVRGEVLGTSLYQLLKELRYAPAEKTIRSVLPKGMQAGLIRQLHTLKRAMQPEHQRQIRSILKQHPTPRAVIVFNPSLDWERQLFQRPQQLAKALANEGALVFYLQLAPLKHGGMLEPISERLYVSALPIEQFSFLEPVFVYTLTWNRKYLLKWVEAHILYDYLDDLSTFEGDAVWLHRDHEALLRESDLVIATASRLFDQAAQVRPDARLIPNGVDFGHFDPNQQQLSTPGDLLSLQKEGKPLIGYYGALASWFDNELIKGLAATRPDLNFVFIGPLHGNSVKESGLLDMPNVHYLGSKPYADLPGYLACFDIAILPFKVNQVTQSTSPIKLFEYFAGGKPVISTPLQEVLQYPEVYVAADSQTFSVKINEILSLDDRSSLCQRLQQTARQNTWESRAESILQAIDQIQLPEKLARAKPHSL